jgi:hypothetical protein
MDKSVCPTLRCTAHVDVLQRGTVACRTRDLTYWRQPWARLATLVGWEVSNALDYSLLYGCTCPKEKADSVPDQVCVIWESPAPRGWEIDDPGRLPTAFCSVGGSTG